MSGIPGLNFTSTRQSTSVATATSIAFNPSTVINFGGGDVSANPSGSATGYPSAPANASGNDGYPSGLSSVLGGGYTPQVTPTGATPSLGTTTPAQQSNGMLPLLLAGGAGLLLLTMDK
ncbi:MAG TPA: hypothetical protein VF194_19650 [Ferrovibrio sp.]|uniref:hypothetical protein n=1 Tax=Ferrovibrio sp. TaxID=1917215 RepID=UPI002ED0E226